MPDSPCGWPIAVGRRVTARQGIYEGADDYGPGGYLCRANEVLYVLRECTWRYPLGSYWVVSAAPNEETYGSFTVAAYEVQVLVEQLELFPKVKPNLSPLGFGLDPYLCL